MPRTYRRPGLRAQGGLGFSYLCFKALALLAWEGLGFRWGLVGFSSFLSFGAYGLEGLGGRGAGSDVEQPLFAREGFSEHASL